MSSMRMKKVVLIGCLALLMHGSLGCASSPTYVTFPEETGDGFNDHAAPVETEPITLDLLYIWPEWQQTMEQTVEIYEQSGQNVRIRPRAIEWDKHYSTLQVLIQADDAPDVSHGWNTEMRDWVRMNAALDITDEVSDLEDTVLSSEWMRSSNLDNRIYAIPFRGTFMVVYYNDEMFEERNLNPPQTMDEFIEVSRVFISEGILPLSMWAKPSGILRSITREFTRDLAINEGIVEQLANMSVPMYDDVYEQGIEKLQFWYEEGIISKDVLLIDRDRSQEMFKNQESAMLLGNNNEFADVVKSLQFRMGITDFPTLTDDGKPRQVHRADGFFVLQSTDYPEESIDFLRFLISPKIQQLWLEETFSVPVIEGLTSPREDFSMILEIAESLPFRYFEGQYAMGYRELVDAMNEDIGDLMTGRVAYEERVDDYESIRIYTQQ